MYVLSGVSSPASARFFAANKISLICLTTGGSSASQTLEKRDAEVKARRLKALLTERGVFEGPNMKLLIFTEHKDSLDFLVCTENLTWGFPSQGTKIISAS